MTSSSRHRRNVPPPPGATATKASIYTRFIPREELSSFAAWNPGDLSGAGSTPATAAPAADTAQRIDPAEQLAEQVRLARQSGYQDGYRDGLVALEGFKQSFARQTTLQVGALLQSIGTQLDALQEEMAQALAATAINLARQIVRSELNQRPEAVASVAEEALDTLLLSARHITLRVHPDDHPLVADGAGEVLAARGARLVADASIARGGCLVESNIGLI
ncbi:MAG TPA: flagellar assembly protein FliH, partial [Caldimonas sp.]